MTSRVPHRRRRGPSVAARGPRQPLALEGLEQAIDDEVFKRMDTLYNVPAIASLDEEVRELIAKAMWTAAAESATLALKAAENRYRDGLAVGLRGGGA